MKRLLLTLTALSAVLALSVSSSGCSSKRRSSAFSTSSSVTSGSNGATGSGSTAGSSSSGSAGVNSAGTAATATATPAPPAGLIGGTGVFLDASGRLPDTSANDFAVAAGDLDKDGTVDLVFGEYDGQARVYLNQNNQTFVAMDGAFPAVVMKSTDIQLVDMNNDTYLDAVVASNFEPVRVFLNDGAANFALSVMVPAANVSFTYKVAIGDANGDGFPDVFLANAGQNTSARAENLLFLNDTQGGLVPAPAGTLPVQNDDTIGALFVDLNGDKKDDLFLANFGVPHRVLINDGNGVFVDESAARLPAGLVTAGTAIAAADFNNDGFVDVFVANEGLPGTNTPPPGEANTLLLNNGAGVFVDMSAALPAQAEATFHVRAFDVDGNGFVDLMLSNLRTVQRLYLNQNGTFTDATATNYPAVNQTPSNSLGLVVADFDGNRTPDVVYARRGEKPFLFLNPAK
ncbi:MAG: VCBS repeat-containing protein [Planctomycetes bacterium]|nr:VCBS repeat-containing protein [Planctomycetota bacterium]